MRAMKQGGIGGFEVQTTYPLEVDGNFPVSLRRSSWTTCVSPARRPGSWACAWISRCAADGPTAVRTSRSTRHRARLRVVRAARSAEIGRRREADRSNSAGAGDAVLHLEPHAADGEAAGRGRRRLRAGSLLARGAFRLTSRRSASRCCGRSRRRRRTPSSATAWKSTTPTGPANFLEEFRKRRGYDLTPYLPALAGDIGDKTGARSPRLGADAHRAGQRKLPHAAARMGPAARHEIPLADLRDSAGHAFQQLAGGSAGRRRLRSGGTSRPRAGRPPRAISTAGRSRHRRPGRGCIRRFSAPRRSI